MTSKPSIGIDLGTTNTCVAYYHDGIAETILSRSGKPTMPSIVSFTSNGRYFGQEAKNKLSNNVKNTVFGVKRLIGRKYHDPKLQDELKYLPYKVVNTKGEPQIRVEYLAKKKYFYIQEISAMLLSEIKILVEEKLKQPIEDVVITVPAAFNKIQRQATADAGKLAGLKVLHLLNEPTAAAIAYTTKRKIQNGDKALVYDFGGGTFDVTILELNNGVFEAKYTDGDAHLGGDDVDNALYYHFLGELETKQTVTTKLSKKAIYRLRKACEKAKCDLSSAKMAEIEIDELYDGFDFYSTISRDEFNTMCDPIFQKTLKVVEKSLAGANIDKSMIKYVVLIGGSTRILRVQELLKEYFVDNIIEMSIDADVAVAQGAAIEAAIRQQLSDPELPIKRVIDIVSLSLGIDTQGGLMSVIIERNTPIPIKKSKTFLTTKDQQSYFLLRIYEGERARFKDNTLLDTFKLEGIPKRPKGEEKMVVTFEVDVDGILSVTATNPSSEITFVHNINFKVSRLSPEEINKKLLEAEQFKLQDENEKKRIAAQLRLRNFAEIQLVENKSNKTISRECEAILEWILRNEDATVELYVEKLADFKAFIER